MHIQINSFGFTVIRLHRLYIKILEDITSVSRTHLPKDFSFLKVRGSFRNVTKKTSVQKPKVQASRKVQYLAAERSRKGWRVKASKGGWGGCSSKRWRHGGALVGGSHAGEPYLRGRRRHHRLESPHHRHLPQLPR